MKSLRKKKYNVSRLIMEGSMTHCNNIQYSIPKLPQGIIILLFTMIIITVYDDNSVCDQPFRNAQNKQGFIKTFSIQGYFITNSFCVVVGSCTVREFVAIPSMNHHAFMISFGSFYNMRD